MKVKFYRGLKNILPEGSVSQMFDLGLNTYFIAKKGKI